MLSEAWARIAVVTNAFSGNSHDTWQADVSNSQEFSRRFKKEKTVNWLSVGILQLRFEVDSHSTHAWFKRLTKHEHNALYYVTSLICVSRFMPWVKILCWKSRYVALFYFLWCGPLAITSDNRGCLQCVASHKVDNLALLICCQSINSWSRLQVANSCAIVELSSSRNCNGLHFKQEVKVG